MANLRYNASKYLTDSSEIRERILLRQRDNRVGGILDSIPPYQLSAQLMKDLINRQGCIPKACEGFTFKPMSFPPIDYAEPKPFSQMYASSSLVRLNPDIHIVKNTTSGVTGLTSTNEEETTREPGFINSIIYGLTKYIVKPLNNLFKGDRKDG